MKVLKVETVKDGFYKVTVKNSLLKRVLGKPKNESYILKDSDLKYQHFSENIYIFENGSRTDLFKDSKIVEAIDSHKRKFSL